MDLNIWTKRIPPSKKKKRKNLLVLGFKRRWRGDGETKVGARGGRWPSPSCSSLGEREWLTFFFKDGRFQVLVRYGSFTKREALALPFRFLCLPWQLAKLCGLILVEPLLQGGLLVDVHSGALFEAFSSCLSLLSFQTLLDCVIV